MQPATQSVIPSGARGARPPDTATEPAHVDVAIVGGGLAGLCVTFELRRRAPGLRVLLLEASDRLGGKVLSETVETDAGRFLVEGGPDCFLAHKPWGRQLVETLGLGDRLVPINEPARPVSVLHHGRPVDLPAGVSLIAPTKLWPFVRTPLLSPLGKLRMGLDLALPARRGDEDESLGAFVRRRFGAEALERLAEPLVAGIYSADPDRLSVQATFPQFPMLERRHRSVIRGLRASRHGAAAGGRTPTFLTLRDGMQELTDALTAEVAGIARCHSRVEHLSRDGGETFSLRLVDGASVVAGQVVLAVPAAGAARLLESLASDASTLGSRLRTTSTGTVSLAFPAAAIRRPLPGYGLVIPRVEARPINAVTIASAKFPGRAPEGWSLLRVFFGGARSPATFAADDDRLLRVVRDQLRDLLGIADPPAFHRIYRWPEASPQYDVGHLDMVGRIEAALPAGVHLTGSPFRGVGVPDIARAAAATADRVLQGLTKEVAR